MTITEMLGQSGILTLLGMAVVFAFLWIMIICVILTGNLLHSFGGEIDTEQTASGTSNKDNAKVSPGVIAAISAAVNEYGENPSGKEGEG